MSISMRAVTADGILEKDDKAVEPEVFTFPGGEHHLRNIPDHPNIKAWVACVRGSDPNDLVKAGLLSDVALGRSQEFALLLPYAPAARADRGEPMGAGVYAEFVNAVGARRVVILDPHSQMVVACLNDVVVADHAPLIERALKTSQKKFHALIAPDRGATERTRAVANRLDMDWYQAGKERDFDTGQIRGIKMTERLPKHGRYLVVDDICDGGGTFMGLADATGLPREKLGLWVTHGIFSGNAHLLRNCYEQIITTDSHPGHNRVDVATLILPVYHHLLNTALKGLL
ncbi:phosphoribosyl pyrophosphate transferase [Mycobacterium phage Thibault]|uniref:Phosphoribosyltransferase n=1 Tax=Mycobacterium phage Thibault TaxID=1052673 RepID=G1FGI0_9CAUD|nr:ribose-phosphate pyrophosphokinase [Mycobacterium phage Thibault]AEJ94038.1 phosphoribosyl pyrophosphate transferase [Mycobacterium phage Thibault]